jgi:hypothetical protein
MKKICDYVPACGNVPRIRRTNLYSMGGAVERSAAIYDIKRGSFSSAYSSLTMAFLSYAVQILSVYAFTRVAWFFLRPLVRKDPLAVLSVPSGGQPFLGELKPIPIPHIRTPHLLSKDTQRDSSGVPRLNIRQSSMKTVC